MLDSGHSPTPGSPEEAAAFALLQEQFPDVYRSVFSDPQAPRTVIVVPSMSLAESELEKIPGAIHYEERMLCLLMLLRLPRTQLIYVTSIDLDPAVVDYYLHLLPGIPSMHARSRLSLLSLNDSSLRPLSDKIVKHPDRLAHLKSLIRYPESAHMTCFNSTELERTLAVGLGVPLYACDPALSHLGNKSRSRSLFRDVGLDLPDGFEDLRDRPELVEALIELHGRNPDLNRAVVKLNDGFSGEGNGVVPIHRLSDATSPKRVADRLLTDSIQFEAQHETWEQYEAKFGVMGGVVEALIEDLRLTSPSVQMRIDPLGEPQLVSTHDQVLAGPSGQVYYGCTFPALDSYKLDLHEAGFAVADALNSQGVLGRFGVDFVSVPEENGWRHYAIEINLRKGGTTLPYLMLEFLTDGEYDGETGDFHTPTGELRTYYATDNLVKDTYLNMTPAELIDAAVYEGIHYHATSQKGLVFHLLGAVTDFGKIGMVSIAEGRSAARRQYDGAVATLDKATA